MHDEKKEPSFSLDKGIGGVCWSAKVFFYAFPFYSQQLTYLDSFSRKCVLLSSCQQETKICLHFVRIL